MRQMPDYRLGVQLSGPEKISYRHSEMIQKKLYSDIFRGVNAKLTRPKADGVV